VLIVKPPEVSVFRSCPTQWSYKSPAVDTASLLSHGAVRKIERFAGAVKLVGSFILSGNSVMNLRAMMWGRKHFKVHGEFFCLFTAPLERCLRADGYTGWPLNSGVM
jgi:hypothetical protein